MFTPDSRYHRLADLVLDDGRGNPVRSRELRPLPEVTARHQHTVAAGERLDELAFRYYGRPTRWWRICDAEHEILSPLALLGGGPVVTLRVERARSATGAPPWAVVVAALAPLPGVEGVRCVDGTPPAVVITVNTLTLDEAAVVAELTKAGFAAGERRRLGRVGKGIAVPPDTVG